MAEKKIGNVVYRCEALTGRDPWKLMLDIKSLLVPLAPIFTMADEMSEGEFASALLKGLGDIEDERLLDTMERLIGLARGDGDVCVWGVKPASMSDALELTAWVLTVQFSDFLAGKPLRAAMSNVLTKIPTAAA